MQNKILYIIAGANGSGKSTLASELLPSENLRFLNCLSGTSLVGVVHTLPSKYAGGIFMRGSEWHRV